MRRRVGIFGPAADRGRRFRLASDAPSMNRDCSAIILAGGQSRRMGRAKAWLEFRGRPLLSHVVERLSVRFDEIVVVAAPGQELPETSARVVRDEAPGKGPVGGLTVGLREIRAPLAFVTAVDAPLLRLELVDLLLEEISDADTAVPEWEGRLQPLCALYRAAAVQPVLAEQLRTGALRLQEALNRLNVRIVSEAQLRRIDPNGVSFAAANTPEEFANVATLVTASEPS
jgi:molybdopterin-guanine dinucleotide biosynthesis protein A